MSFVKRLLIVLWIPPILALALWYVPGMFFSRSGSQGLEPPSISATLSTLPLIGLFGFGYCLIPSMVSWGVLEVAWRFGPKLLQRRLPSEFLGGILGLVSGWVIICFAYTSGHRLAHFYSGPLTGLLCGLVVTPLIRRHRAHADTTVPPLDETKARFTRLAAPFLKACALTGAAIVASIGILIAGFKGYLLWEYHLPSQEHVLKQFERHRTDFREFVETLRKDPTTKFIGDGGQAFDASSIHSRMVPEYRAWLSKLGVKSVRIQEDGSIDFTMGGFGGAIMSDSYIGIRYSPALPSANRPGWNPTVVKSLNDSALPQEHGRVASGYYVVPIEPTWYVYRFEYLE